MGQRSACCGIPLVKNTPAIGAINPEVTSRKWVTSSLPLKPLVPPGSLLVDALYAR